MEAEVFRTPQVDCPHCGIVMDVDESQINTEVDCTYCYDKFTPTE